MIAGVCGGLAEYFAIDSSLVRVAAVLFTFAGGAGILAYIVLWLIVPQKPIETTIADKEGAADQTATSPADESGGSDKGIFLVGVVLTILGVLLLLNNYLPFSWLSFRRLWPLLLIFLGVLIIMKGAGGKQDEN